MFCKRVSGKYRINVKWAVFVSLIVVLSPFAGAEQGKASLTHKEIVDSTWSLHVWKVLGWQYDSPVWTKGSEEPGQVGQKSQLDAEKNVRAVCLGKEGEFYVFFTLRSFLDPTFPNLFVQGVKVAPLDLAGKPFAESAIVDQSYIRYGRLSLTLYENQGGGTFKILRKITGMTHCDPNNPKAYGRSWISKKTGYSFHETINDVQYERPNKNVSAKEHLILQKETKIMVKYVGEHDVALLYVPESLIAKYEPIATIGMSNPTLAVQLMLNHNKDLFGYEFVLIGQETIDLIKKYTPKNNDSNFKGFQKLISVVGLALGEETLGMLKTVDTALDHTIPDQLAAAKTSSDLKVIAWNAGKKMAMDIVKDKKVISAIREYFLRKIGIGK